jgi:hypothetical protein
MKDRKYCPLNENKLNSTSSKNFLNSDFVHVNQRHIHLFCLNFIKNIVFVRHLKTLFYDQRKT